MRRDLAVILLVVGAFWFLGSFSSNTPPSSSLAPKLSAEQLLTNGRELFDQWQKPESRKEVTLNAVASVMRGLNELQPSDKLYATARQAIDVLRPIRETLADQEIERQRIETDKRQKELQATLAAERKRVEGDASGRKAYANELEHRYLKRGMDVHVSVEGDRNTTLKLRWVLISRPTVYNFINDRDLMSNLKSRGFRQLVMTDGYNSTWRQKID